MVETFLMAPSMDVSRSRCTSETHYADILLLLCDIRAGNCLYLKLLPRHQKLGRLCAFWLVVLPDLMVVAQLLRLLPCLRNPLPSSLDHLWIHVAPLDYFPVLYQCLAVVGAPLLEHLVGPLGLVLWVGLLVLLLASRVVLLRVDFILEPVAQTTR